MALKDFQILNLYDDNPVNRSFYCNNGDKNTRGLEVHVLDNAQPKDCTGLTLELVIRVPSGEYFKAAATPLTIATGVFQVLFPNNMGKGRFIAELILSSGPTEVLVSRKFSILGDGSLTSDGSIQATPSGGMLWTALQNIDAAVAARYASLEEEYATDLTEVKTSLAQITTGNGMYGVKAERPSANLYPGREFFLTDLFKRIEYNGVNWQYLDGTFVDLLQIVDGNLYANYSFAQQSVASGGVPIGAANNPIDMTKDFLYYSKVKLADSNDFFHLSFKIGTAYQFQLSFGVDWTNANLKDGTSISIYDYINTNRFKVGSLNLYTSSHDVVVWYDHKWGYLNVYIDNILIGSWKPVAGGANIAGVDTVATEIGSGATLVTFDYIYMANPLVTVIGDSIMCGAIKHAPNPEHYAGVDDYGNGFPKLLSDYLKSKGIKNYFIVNKGVNSDTTLSMKSRFNADVVVKGCKYVLIQGGINDYTTNDVSATVQNKNDMAATAELNNIQPFILGVIPTRSNSVSNSHQFAIDLRAAEQSGYAGKLYADLWKAIEGTTANTADETKMDDTVHPNLVGYTAMKDEIVKYIS